MTHSTRSRAEILRYFFALVAVLSTSSLLMTAWTYSVQHSERAQRERLGEFHLRIAFLTGEARAYLDEIDKASETRSTGEATARDLTPSLSRERAIQTSAVALGQALGSIVDLHNAWVADSEPFRASLERAMRQYDRLRDAVRHDGPERHVAISREAGAIRFSLYQLDRLHAIAAAASLEAVARSGATRARRTAIAIASVLLVSALLIWRLLVMVRARLHEQEMTAALLRDRERQLRHASKMEALGTLVGGVAHDFNNIMTAIIGNVELMQEETHPADPRHGTLDEIRRAGERAATLTRQLLTFSRQQTVDARVVDLNALLEDLEPILRRLIREDVKLAIRLEAEPCSVEVDPVQMEQVMLNLAVNARDAMTEGGELTFRVSRERLQEPHPGDAALAPGEYVRVRVEDTGCGMCDETLARVFDPFFTTKAPGRGTGLGLSTVHGIVRKSGGRVLVSSELGRGTRFDIYLPRSRKPVEVVTAERRSAPTAGGSETLLLAEGEPHVRKLASHALRLAGYTVHEAGDGREALNLSSRLSGRLDLIVSDVVMPGLRGPEMVERARELHPDVAVLFISGYNEDGTEGGGAGRSSGHLQKPFTMNELLAAVRERLDRRGEPAERGESVLAGQAARGA